MKYHLNKADRIIILRIVAIYAFVSGLWIYTSDHLLGLLVRDPAILIRYSVFKGFLFIAVTVFILYHLIAEYIMKSRQSEMLIQQSRMTAMGEMLGNIAHQWRQPLNLLGLRVQQLAILRETGELSREVLDDNIDKIMNIVLNLSNTIDDFRSFSLPEKEKKLFSVDQVLTKTISLIKESFNEQQIQLDIDSSGDVRLKGYPNEYAQVLLNILMNARDAFRERHTKEPRIIIRSFTKNNKAVLTIRDNAGGIKEEIIDKIFDAYFTTKSLGKGTGVGLFMSKTIIEYNMGGRLTVCNVGDGAEFRIEV